MVDTVTMMNLDMEESEVDTDVDTEVDTEVDMEADTVDEVDSSEAVWDTVLVVVSEENTDANLERQDYYFFHIRLV